jgi:hypothetical protein
VFPVEVSQLETGKTVSKRTKATDRSVDFYCGDEASLGEVYDES